MLVQRLISRGLTNPQIKDATGIHEVKISKYRRAITGENPKKFKRAQELCLEADVKSKSQSNVTSYIAVERLISALCALFCR